MTELEKACEKVINSDEYYIEDFDTFYFREGFKAALKPEHMKLTPEVQNLVKMLKIHDRVLRKMVEDRGGVYEGYLAKNTAKALKPFEKEG